MITELDKLLAPEWLATVSEESRLPSMDQLLRDSLYYPASGLNGTPVKFLAGNVYSFIYADYGVDRTAFLDNLNGTDPECGFRHYHSMCQRDVFREDIVPNDWRPPITPTEHGDRQRLEERERACRLFGHWSVWQRDATASTAVGPERFSFLFLAGEMSAIYQGLYSRMGIAPRILAIIQPGTMGGEWESVT